MGEKVAFPSATWEREVKKRCVRRTLRKLHRLESLGHRAEGWEGVSPPPQPSPIKGEGVKERWVAGPSPRGGS